MAFVRACRCTVRPVAQMNGITWGPINPGSPVIPIGPDPPCRDKKKLWSTVVYDKLRYIRNSTVTALLEEGFFWLGGDYRK